MKVTRSFLTKNQELEAEGLAVKILSDGFTTVSLSPISSYSPKSPAVLVTRRNPHCWSKIPIYLMQLIFERLSFTDFERAKSPFDHCGPAAFSMDHKLFTERGPSI
ncbi:hypothetical protein YC2023_122636 [Brassica napus]